MNLDWIGDGQSNQPNYRWISGIENACISANKFQFNGLSIRLKGEPIYLPKRNIYSICVSINCLSVETMHHTNQTCTVNGISMLHNSTLPFSPSLLSTLSCSLSLYFSLCQIEISQNVFLFLFSQFSWQMSSVAFEFRDCTHRELCFFIVRYAIVPFSYWQSSVTGWHFKLFSSNSNILNKVKH